MKKLTLFKRTLCATLTFALISSQAWGHSRWLVPTHTILSGEDPEMVAVDMSISNDIFHPDFAFGGLPVASVAALLAGEKDAVKTPPPNTRGAIVYALMSTTKVAVTQPDGSVTNDTPLINFGRKSTAAFTLNQSGTYRVNVTQDPIYFTKFKHADGRPGREFGERHQVETFLPEGAKDISVLKLINRVETYVTRNGLNKTALAPSGKGLEILFDGHPNELFVGEDISAKIMLNGKAAPIGTEVKLTRSGTRHRNDREHIVAATDKSGAFSVSIEQSGFYLLEVELEREGKGKDADTVVYGLYLTLEVNAE